jgi:hypothetical protein
MNTARTAILRIIEELAAGEHIDVIAEDFLDDSAARFSHFRSLQFQSWKPVALAHIGDATYAKNPNHP